MHKKRAVAAARNEADGCYDLPLILLYNFGTFACSELIPFSQHSKTESGTSSNAARFIQHRHPRNHPLGRLSFCV